MYFIKKGATIVEKERQNDCEARSIFYGRTNAKKNAVNKYREKDLISLILKYFFSKHSLEYPNI